MKVRMEGVEEYQEGFEVDLDVSAGTYIGDGQYYGEGELVITAYNTGGYLSTEVNLEQTLKWVSENKPEIYMKFVTEDLMIKYA